MASNSKPFGNIKKGALHKELGIKQDKPIPLATLDAAHAKAVREHNVTLERRTQFAINARKFKH